MQVNYNAKVDNGISGRYVHICITLLASHQQSILSLALTRNIKS